MLASSRTELGQWRGQRWLQSLRSTVSSSLKVALEVEGGLKLKNNDRKRVYWQAKITRHRIARGKPLCFYPCRYMYVCMCVYVCKYVCKYVSMYVCMYLCKYVCLSVCLYVCLYMYVDHEVVQKDFILSQNA